MSSHGKSYHVEIQNVTLISSTSRSGKFRLNDHDGTIIFVGWNQVDEGSVDKDGETGVLIIPRWLAEREEIDVE